MELKYGIELEWNRKKGKERGAEGRNWRNERNKQRKQKKI